MCTHIYIYVYNYALYMYCVHIMCYTCIVCISINVCVCRVTRVHTTSDGFKKFSDSTLLLQPQAANASSCEHV